MTSMSHPLIRQTRHEWSPRSFLGHLSPEPLGAFVEAAEIQHIEKDEVLMTEGEEGTHVILLLMAAVKVTAALPDGGEALLAVRVAGDVLGELSAIDGQPRLATVRACSHDRISALNIPAKTFNSLLDEYAPAHKWLLTAMSAKLRTSTQRRIDYTGFDAHVRLARVLLELAVDHGFRPRGKELVIGVNLTQLEMGSLVGVAEATAQRGLRKLRDQGLVLTDGRRPIIRDLEGLRAAAGLI